MRWLLFLLVFIKTRETSELASWAKGLDNTAAAAQVSCLACAEKSTCYDNTCYCDVGYSGDQPVRCLKTEPEEKPKLLVPLWNSEPTRDNRGHCNNDHWARTAEQGAGTVVFVDVVDSGKVNDYYECLQMMFDAEATIYLRVSAMHGFAFGLEDEITKLHNEYKDVISGFYIDDTPSDLADSSIMKTLKQIKQLRSDKYKVAISAHESQWPMKLISTKLPNQRADMLVVFDSTWSKWSRNCGVYGAGPYCRTEFDKKGFFDVLQTRINSGRVPRKAFGVIVNDVSADNVVEVLENAVAAGVGYIHVTDKVVGESSYWDYILLNINQDEVCGCFDSNECQVSNDCDVNAYCVNSDGSYECICQEGFAGDGKTSGTGCHRDSCADCSSDAVCTGDGKCHCGEGLTGTGLACPETSSFVMLDPPENSTDICADTAWIRASYLAIEKVDTIVVVDVLKKNPESIKECLKLVTEAGARVFHEESLWNGFKKKQMVEMDLTRVSIEFNDLVDGVYFSSTPSELEPIFGDKEYFNDILLVAKHTNPDFLIGADLWMTRWEVAYLTGAKKNGFELSLPNIDYATIFRSNFEDWYSECSSGHSEGPFCKQRSAGKNLLQDLQNALARGTVKQKQIIAQIYSVDLEEFEKVFKLANNERVGRLMVTSGKQNEKNTIENWKGFIRSLQGNWLSCACWDINECSLSLSDCNSTEICANTLGSYHCIDPLAPPISASRTFVPRVCATDCAEHAQCDENSGECVCNNGFTGSGVECSQVTQEQNLVIPLSQIPTIVEDNYRKLVCTDQYWHAIANLEKATVILTVTSWNWQPCIELLYQNGVDIYWKISLYNGAVYGDIEKALRDYLDQIKSVYNGMVNPYFVKPGETYKTDLIYNSINYAKSLGLKVGFDAQNADWDVDFIKDYGVDLTVLFRDSYEKFTSNCNTLGMGPYCPVDMDGKEWSVISRVTDLVLEVQRGNIEADNVATIIYNAAIGDFDVIKQISNNFGSNGLWMTENSHYNGAQPSYWNELVEKVTISQSTRNSCGCEDKDECQDGHNCGPYADCLNMPGGFSCVCSTGYSGNGIVCSPTDACLNNSHNCPADSTCTSTGPGTYNCVCNDGYSGEYCNDINECSKNLHNCDSNAACINDIGTFSCMCKSGFTGDGTKCADIDECENVNFCTGTSFCENSVGSYKCTCLSGFTGLECYDVDECDEGIDGCSDDGTCTNTEGSYTCQCKPGFAGDGFTCSVDACENCDSLATCENNACVCPVTHSGTGSRCLETSSVRKAVIPLSKIPTITNGECTDPYWSKISSMGDGTSVILRNYQTTWKPCVSMLRSKSILVFATVNARKGQLANMETYLKDQIDSLKPFYDGIFIRNPGNKGFQQSYYDEVFSYAKSQDFKVGVDGYNNKYDASVAEAVDLVITFNDDLEFFSSKCGSNGVGIFCRNSNKLSKHDYEEIKSKLDNGQLSRDTFSAIVMYVPEQRLELTMLQARSEFGGGVFVSNHYAGDTSEPNYFSEYRTMLDTMLKKSNRQRRSGDDCGCSPRDECSDGSHSCPSNSDCSDLDNGYSCTCSAGWTDDNSADFNCVDIDECSKGGHACHLQASCVNSPGSYVCQCDEGFSGDGKSCVDVNECQLDKDDCHVNATCINKEGGHICQCKDGFEGNGVSCSDINECLTKSSCPQNSNCINSIGSYQCDCLPGFFKSNGSCLNNDECTTSDHNCDPYADCMDTTGSFVCTCKDGYDGDGTYCGDVDECQLLLDDCPAHSTCQNTVGSFQCVCETGFFMDDKVCIDRDECKIETDSCSPKADCANTLGSFTCQCKEGFVGDGFVCDVDICTLCDSDATCNGSECQCPATSTGSGISCDSTSTFSQTESVTTIPISKIPTMMGKSTECTDPYWLKIAQMGQGTNVILTSQQPSWTPCIEKLRENSVNVFAAVNGRKGKLSDMVSYFSDEAENLLNDYGGSINGVYITNPGQKGFRYSWYKDVFSNLAQKGLKVGILGYNNKYDAEVAKQVDLVVAFFDVIGKFNKNCGEHGIGVLCQNNKLTADLFDEINNSFNDGTLKRSRFAAIVGYVREMQMELTILQAKSLLTGQVFVTNYYIGDTREPDYFDAYINAVNTQLKKELQVGLGKSANCGCKDNNECDLGTHECPDNSDCNDMTPGYNCTCATGYEHDKSQLSSLSCIDINECISNEHNCDANANCVNNEGSFSCNCNEGYAGDGLYCSDINECVTRTDSCDANAVCKNLEGSHACVCNAGFTGDGISCSDKDECTDGSHDCHQESSCQNSIGSFSCSCRTGFTGDGKTCMDIDECKLRTDNCDYYATCTNNYGSYVCSCDAGYDGDGYTCENIDECSTALDSCPDQSTCSDTEGSYTCTCNVGFFGSGSNCLDFDECAFNSDNCSPDADCSNTFGSYDCRCKEGFKGDGIACSVDICTLCDESATCDGTHCTCPAGQSGSGVACDATTESNSTVVKSVIPLNKIPLITAKTNQCSDSYWRKIGEMGKGTAVLLQYHEPSWLTCIEHLRDSGVDVYATVNGRKGQMSDMVQYFKDEVDSIIADYSQLVNGIYIRNPGKEGFMHEWFDAVFDYARTKSTKIALEGYSNVYTEKVAEKVDLIVTFKDNVENFDQNCGSNGIGVFCRNNKLTGDQIAAIESSISQGVLSRDQFAAVISNVPESKMELTILRAKTSLAGSVFVSDYDKSNWREPTYFDEYVTAITEQLKKRQRRGLGSSSNCGCSDTDECTTGSHSCPNYSTCINESPGFKCECFEGYIKSADGLECEDVDECSQQSHSCDKNALCKNTLGSFECSCVEGYIGDGKVCSDVNECDKADSCHVYATCTNYDGSHACLCNSGYSGDGVICDDVDECMLGTDKCSSTSECKNTLGSYLCSCLSGYSGDNCEDVNECQDATSNNCHKQAECINTDGSFSCSCKTGYSGDGQNCVDDNECNDNTDDCDGNSQCINTAGSFRCQCSVGFMKQTAGTCQDVDECDNYSHTCHAKADCVNSIGSYDCLCISGYAGDGYTCSDVDECLTGSAKCAANSACMNSVGSYTCECDEGYSGTSGVCTDLDECLAGSDTCSAHATCENTVGSYTCTCKEGYFGNGYTCDVDPCALCDAMATCENNSCECPASHSGNGVSCDQLEDAGVDIVRLTVVPLSRIPVITVRSAICRDPYWQKIAKLGPGTSVILRYSSPTWLPCIEELKINGLDVYITINARKAQLSDMDSYFDNELDKISQDYGSNVNGVYLRNPGNAGFRNPIYDSVFDKIKSKGFKIGIDGYGNNFNAEVVKKTNIVVLFKDTVDALRTQCGVYGPGPLCRNTVLSDSDINEIENEIIFGSIQQTQFVSIVYDTPRDILAATITEALSTFAGLTFISDLALDNTAESSYFDEFVSLIAEESRSEQSIGARVMQDDCGCEAINECEVGNPCPANSECYDTTSGYECKCAAGYKNDPAASDAGAFACIDVDECYSGGHTCDTYATCSNTDGAFECACKDGYAGDGKVCSDINECAQEDICDQNATCQNLQGHHSCVCNDGYSGDGLTCADIDECSTKTSVCHPNAQCSNNIGSYECDCNEGFTGDGLTCSDIDECLENRCHAMASCINSVGSYTCECVEGFSGDGVTCSQDICSLCDSAATCDGLTCTCQVGFTGSGTMCAPATRVVIPIQRIPLISVRTGMCSDPFWHKIAQLDSATIITRLQDHSWKPCLAYAQQNGVEVFATIDARKMKLTESYVKNQVQAVFETFNTLLAGIHFENPGTEGFIQNEWSEIFSFTRTANYKISVEGYENKYNMNTVNQVDLIVRFRDNLAKFPYSNDLLTSSFENDLQQVLSEGLISRTKFVDMVFNVAETSMENVIDFADTGSLYITDRQVDNMFATSMPAYWDLFVQKIAAVTTLARSGTDCGCKDVNECSDDTACQDNASCFNSAGSFTCTCNAGYILQQGLCVDVNECLTGVCADLANCNNNDGSYSCTCPIGYAGDGLMNGCYDEDECLEGTHTCSENSSCYNTVGSYNCPCEDGFTNNGSSCQDIDECLDVSICKTDSNCINTEGSFDCQCKSGYTESSTGNCADIDECSEVNLCHAMASCSNTDGSYECECVEGYEGDGKTCSQDICSMCDSTATCETGASGKNCVCPAGFTGDGLTCETSSVVIPISKMPKITAKSIICRDEFWLRIATNAQTMTTKVILDDVFDQTWMPCLDLLHHSGVLIFATVDARGGKFSDTESLLKNAITNIKSSYNSTIQGVHLTNPGSDGYIDGMDYKSIISFAKEMNLKVSIDGYQEKWNHEIALLVDQVVIFKDTAPKWKSKCTTSFGPGPFCRQKQMKSSQIDLINESIENKVLSKSKFVVMLFKVPKYSLVNQLNDTYDSISSSVFVTDAQLTGDVEPSYWDTFLAEANSLLNSQNGRLRFSSSGCGCKDFDECSEDVCPVNSNCINKQGGYECHCEDGFTSVVSSSGELQCVDNDECKNAPCGAYSSCSNTIGSFECTCDSGYTGDGFICNDIDECLSIQCPRNMDCSNTAGGYVCSCKTGFDEDMNKDCVDIDECVENIADCDPNYGICNNNDGSFTCSCQKGFEYQGQNCVDVDECQSTSCVPYSSCINTLGSYECKCDDGYTADGDDCVDIDECLTSTDTCPSEANCINTPGSFDCECKFGFTGDGFSCSDKDECSSGVDLCHSMATCANTHGSYTCTCIENWLGDGHTCSQDICSVCADSATCDGTSCVCPAGFSGSGITCDIKSLAIPIQRTPVITARTAICKDPYWLKIAQNQSSTVILNLQDPSWSPCVDLLTTAGIDVYGTVDLKNGNIQPQFDFAKNAVDQALTTKVSGIMLTNPGSNGYSVNYVTDIIDYVKSQGKLVGVDAYNVPVTMEIVHQVDHVVLFRDIYNKFFKKCLDGRQKGPFCRQSSIADKFIEDLRLSLENGLDRSKLSSMIFRTDESELTDTLNKHFENTFYGRVFVSDQREPDLTHEPGYFNDLQSYISASKARSSENCGCYDRDECQEVSVCPVNSECTNTPGDYNCSCKAGYETVIKGSITACIDVDECMGSPCDVNSICINSDGSYQCVCTDGFEGNGILCNDTNECLLSDTCQDYATCVNQVGSYKCICNDGYTLIDVLGSPQCIDINECLVGTHGCHQYSLCTNTNGSHSCECKDGFTGTGTHCQDTNECTTANDECDPNAVCLNTVGSFTCDCKNGYYENAGKCLDVDECVALTHSCHENALCTNAIPGYSCTCSDGFAGDGFTCEDVDECLAQTSNCHPMADCINSVGSYECQCVSGWDGDGFLCSQDICALCDDKASCGTSCQCPQGYHGSGLKCDSNSLMIPIQRTPLITARTAVCRDEYWREIAATQGAGVILNLQEPTWLPCIDLVKDAGVDIYVTINARKSGSFQFIQSEIDSTLATFGQSISGVIIRNPHDSKGYLASHYQDVFSYVKSKGLKVGIIAFNQKFDLEVLKTVDHAVIFRGTKDQYMEDCTHKPGPFCKQSQLSSETIVEIENALSQKVISPDNVSTMVFNVHESEINSVIALHYASVSSGGLFISDQANPKLTHRPAYFDLLKDVVQSNTLSRSTFSCGCQDTDECLTAACGANTACTNSDGSYSCQCLDGFRETADGSCIDIDECTTETHNCNIYASCANTEGSFECTCNAGWTAAGRLTCNDVDECAAKVDSCDAKATCLNTPGSFDCVCQAGFEGDGQTCVDVDECLILSTCGQNMDCTNTSPGFICECKSGYKLDSNSGACVDIDECSDGPNDCHLMAKCYNAPGSFSCSCLDGFHGDGRTCESDVCATCEEGTTCDGAGCQCPAGTSGSGIKCSKSTMLIPLSKTPTTELKTCTDSYWLKISQLKSVNVLVDNVNDSWIPCLRLLKSNGVAIFYTIIAEQEKSMNWNLKMVDKVTQVQESYGDLVNGINLINPSKSLGYTDEKYLALFNFLRAKQLQISIDGQNGLFNLEVVNLVDIVVLKYGQKGTTNSLTETLKSKLIEAIDSKMLRPNKFASIIYGVNSEQLKNELDSHFDGRLSGHIFISDSSLVGVTREPLYFDDLVRFVLSKRSDQTSCGCSDIDECQLGLDQCVANSDCINVPVTRDSRGYQCHCSTGYTYDLSSGSFICVDIDECNNGDHSCDSSHSSCVNTEASYSCSCIIGYKNYSNDELVCVDIDECADASDDCLADEECQNTVGSFTCTPKTNPANDECSLGVDICPTNSFCVDTSKRRDPRGYMCYCDVGYVCNTCFNQADSSFFSCDDIDECSSSDQSCHASSTCENTPGSYQCKCSPTEEMINDECIPIEKCLTGLHQCPENSECKMTQGTSEYTCHCLSGYRPTVSHQTSGALLSCSDIDECFEGSHSCVTGESCINSGGSFSCLTIDCAAAGCSHYCEESGNGGVECTCPAGYNMDDDKKTCTDVDECRAGLHSCVDSSECINTLRIPRKGKNFLSVLTTNGFLCRCPIGFDWDTNGSSCVNINECTYDSQLCEADEFCVDTEGSYECITADCTVLGCSHTCDQGKLPCSCPDDLVLGADGLQCEDKNECSLNLYDCPSNSQCVNTRMAEHQRGSYCACDEGYTAVQSSDGSYICVDVDECESTLNQCVENSICINTKFSKKSNRGYECRCVQGYIGAPSSDGSTLVCVDIDECLTGSHSCQSTEVCTNQPGSFSCSDRDECSSSLLNECVENSHCLNVRATKFAPKGYECHCDSGYQGVQNSQGELECVNVDECATGLHVCVENSDCIDVTRSVDTRGYQCHCKQGFTSDLSTGSFLCVDVDECATASDNCKVTENCVNTVGSYQCQPKSCSFLGCSHSCQSGQCLCPGGMRLNDNKLTCEEINECVEGTHICPANTDCVHASFEIFGGYQCHCKSGFISDISTGSFQCVDIDECELNVDDCLADELCLNLPGSFVCTPDESDDNNECLIGTHACTANSHCVNAFKRSNPRGYNCYCDKGYHCEGCSPGSDFLCTDFDECASSNDVCTASQTCQNTEGSYVCLDNVCLSLACSHSCHDGVCTCPAGWTLDVDQSTCVNTNECILGTHDCPENSICFDTTLSKLNPKGYSCSCLTGFVLQGDECIDQDECSLGFDNCTQDEVCVNSYGSFSCEPKCASIGCSHSCDESSCLCPTGMELGSDGKNCDDIDECALGTHSCVPNSLCLNTSFGRSSPKGYNCYCDSGFEYDVTLGVFTCKDIDECNTGTHNCSTDQVCSNTEGGFECVDESQCDLCSHDCVNGKCTCPNGLVLDHTGVNCEITDDHVAIKCNPNYMEVLVEGAYFKNTDGLQLNDPDCNVNKGYILDQANGDYLIRVGLDECNNDVTTQDGSITFSNTLFNTYQTAPTKEKNGLIFKELIVTVKFSCVYSTTVDVDGAKTVEASFLRGSASGKGDFSFDIETYSDPDFAVQASTGFRTGDIMYFDVTNRNPMDGIKFSVIECTVFNEEKTESYLVIEDKCGDDYIATKHLDGYASEVRARFSYTVFEFVDSDEDPDENQTLQDSINIEP